MPWFSATTQFPPRHLVKNKRGCVCVQVAILKPQPIPTCVRHSQIVLVGKRNEHFYRTCHGFQNFPSTVASTLYNNPVRQMVEVLFKSGEMETQSLNSPMEEQGHHAHLTPAYHVLLEGEATVVPPHRQCPAPLHPCLPC